MSKMENNYAFNVEKYSFDQPYSPQLLKRINQDACELISFLMRIGKISVHPELRKIQFAGDVSCSTILPFIPIACQDVPEIDDDPWAVYRDSERVGHVIFNGPCLEPFNPITHSLNAGIVCNFIPAEEGADNETTETSVMDLVRQTAAKWKAERESREC